MGETLRLSKKYREFIKCKAPVEFLEGTTAAGKTTVGIFKFMLKVAASPKKLHIISGLDLGVIEKNIINKDLGICDLFGALVQYNASGRGEHSLPHLLFQPSSGDKIIYILGYDNKARWKKALGGQYGCLYIDEINIADMEYVREASMRCDYLMATLNPDDPNLAVYGEYINCSRPLPEWEADTPEELREMLCEEHKPGWTHWFFSFKHNLGLPKEKIDQIMLNTPKGTKLWKNKIEGLRGRSTGIVFPNFSRKKHVVSVAQIKNAVQQKEIRFICFSAGLDTSYSSQSEDTIAMSFIGITQCRRVVTLAEQVYCNKDLTKPLAPSDTVEHFIAFLEQNRNEWGFARDVFIDSADQATITELNKHKRLNGSLYNFINAYKKVQIIDRIKLQLGWLQQERFLILDTCPSHINELESYSWQEEKNNVPEDRNDHTINANQYAWIPFRQKIGFEQEGGSV